MSGTLGEGIFDYLGSVLSCGDRVYPQVLPERCELPAVAWQVVSGPGPITSHDDAHATVGLANDTLMRARLQLSCWGRTHKEASDLGNEVVQAIHAFHGYWGTLEVGSFLVDFTFDGYDEKRGVYRRLVDGMIQYVQTSGS